MLTSTKQAYDEASLSNWAGGMLILKHFSGIRLSGILFLKHSGEINGRNAPRNAILKAFRRTQWTECSPECYFKSIPADELNGMPIFWHSQTLSLHNPYINI